MQIGNKRIFSCQRTPIVTELRLIGPSRFVCKKLIKVACKDMRAIDLELVKGRQEEVFC
jgi:hypothetical protein